MGDLRQSQQPGVVRPERGRPPAQGGAEHRHRHHLARVPTPENPRRQEEHPDLGEYADRPEQAQAGGGVAVLAQIDGEEGVVGAERDLDEEGGDEERAHRRLLQACPETGLVRGIRFPRRMLVMVGVGRGQQRGQQRQHQPGQAAGTETVEQWPVRGHHHDEADRTPDPHLAVAMRLRGEMAQGDRFELRHHRVVGEAERAHHHEQAGESQRQQEERERQQGQPASQVQPADGARRTCRQRGPGAGREYAGGIPQAHQYADCADLHATRLQEQAPVGRERTQCGVVREIEAGQPRHRNGGGRCHSRSCTGAASSSRVPCASRRRREMPRSRISEWLWCGSGES